MTDKLEDTSLRLKDEMDLYRTIMDKLWHNRHEFQKEKESMQEVRTCRRPTAAATFARMRLHHLSEASLPAADRRPAAGAGVPAVLQARDGASGEGQGPVGTQRQDQGDGDGA